jgi:amino acid adenylation domain-containing protein
MLLHQYLQLSASRFPEKIAVKFKEEAIGYLQLDALSNQIARTLLANGVLPGAKVGLYLSKSIPAVAAIYGILKAGAVYVPLDPDSPLERTRYIIANCDIESIIVDEVKLIKLLKNSEILPGIRNLFNVAPLPPSLPGAPKSWHIVCRDQIERQPESPPCSEPIAEDQLAYILYTSGSTGQPKGVMLTHRNAFIFVDWAVHALGLTAQDIFASHAPFHFDLSIFDLYAAGKCGGTLCLIPPGTSYFPDALLNFISHYQITVWYSVPSALIQLLTLANLKTKLASIRTLIYAGEVFPYHYLNQLRPVLTNARIYNFYGPTETNVITAYRVDGPPDEPLQNNVPIGKPCPYARIAVVDEHQQPVPPGTTGELIVNGTSLMQGYWGDPEKTAQKIRQVTLEGREDLYYFTGDLVVEQPGGNLVYINRRDHMVKVRGFRVELGEVESALYRHPSIAKAAVIAVPHEKVSHRLIAFVAYENETVLTPDDIEKHCNQFLPAYMIPERFIILNNLPLSSTGKIDREALRCSVEA